MALPFSTTLKNCESKCLLKYQAGCFKPGVHQAAVDWIETECGNYGVPSYVLCWCSVRVGFVSGTLQFIVEPSGGFVELIQ